MGEATIRCLELAPDRYLHHLAIVAANGEITKVMNSEKEET